MVGGGGVVVGAAQGATCGPAKDKLPLQEWLHPGFGEPGPPGNGRLLESANPWSGRYAHCSGGPWHAVIPHIFFLHTPATHSQYGHVGGDKVSGAWCSCREETRSYPRVFSSAYFSSSTPASASASPTASSSPSFARARRVATQARSIGHLDLGLVIHQTDHHLVAPLSKNRTHGHS